MALISLSQLRPPRRLIQVRLYRLVNQNPPTFDSSHRIISRFWYILLVRSFSYPFYHSFPCLFSNVWVIYFLQVLPLPCLAYSTFLVSRGHNFRFSFASFCYCCSYMYFILVRPFCFGLFNLCSIWLREPILLGTKYFCLCLRSGPLVSGSRFCFGKNCFGYTVQGPVSRKSR